MEKLSFQPNQIIESGTVLGTMNTEVNKPHKSLPLWGLQSGLGVSH